MDLSNAIEDMSICRLMIVGNNIEKHVAMASEIRRKGKG